MVKPPARYAVARYDFYKVEIKFYIIDEITGLSSLRFQNAVLGVCNQIRGHSI